MANSTCSNCGRSTLHSLNDDAAELRLSSKIDLTIRCCTVQLHCKQRNRQFSVFRDARNAASPANTPPSLIQTASRRFEYDSGQSSALSGHSSLPPQHESACASQSPFLLEAILHLSRWIMSPRSSGLVPSFKTIASRCRLRIWSSSEL